MNTQFNRIRPVLVLAVMALKLAFLPSAWSQTFTTNSPLLTARWSHSATWLTNGLVLIAGGTTANEYPDNPDRATNSCELYDPVSSTFTLTGAMADAHAGHFAVVLTNGLVLVVGGRNDHGNIISQAELYDASTGNWTNTGFLNQERSAFAAALLPGGQVLVAAGFTDHGDESSAELYDPVTGLWALTSPLNYAADSLTATVLADGRVLVAGGSDGLGGSRTNASLFNPTNHTWTPTGPLKTGRAGHAATLLPNGKVLVVGGAFDNSTELYDPTTGHWTTTGELNEGRLFPSLTLLPNGQALVIGGFPDQTTAELYEPTTGTWTNAAELHVGRMFHTATLMDRGQVLVTGGDSGLIDFYNGPALADVETYNQISKLFFALDATNLVWTTGGDADWFIETTNTHDNVSAAQSGPIGDNAPSWVQTTVTGPGTLSFWWQVSSEDGADILEFYLDDAPQEAITGTGAGWTYREYSIPAGTHTLKWQYLKNSSGSAGFDAGFLDEVNFVPDPPSLNVTAAPVTGPLPLVVQFSSPRFDSRGNTITNWHWSFGDGGTSTARNPLHLYTSIGSFSPSLVAYSTNSALPLPVTGPGAITVIKSPLNLAVGTEPQLNIQLVGNQIVLTILNRPPGTVLETATDPLLPAPWPELIPLPDSQNYLLLEPAGVKRYFRLRAPVNFNVAAVAPPLNETTFVDVASAAEFIYAGTNGIQTGVANGVIQPARAAVLRGRVLRRDGSALAGARVSVLDHPELGQTFTRADGHYDLAVNGGFELRVNFEKTAYLPAQRTLTVRVQDYQSLPDVILAQLDPAVTAVALGTNSPGTVARGSTQTDADGTRTATLLFPPGTCANLVMPDGATQACNGLMIRATEYTVGGSGPAAMPAALPPTSGYTYAVELSADEAINAGAKTVLFDRDVPYYLENFIGFPVGTPVPVAFYDRDRAAWIPTPNGMVIRIVQVINNLAEVDTDGDALADADHGASLGITTTERQHLATLYAAGQTLWRVPIRHFSPRDLNWPVGPEQGAALPGQPEPQSGRPKLEDSNQVTGYGVVDIENQVLRESVPIAGTPFSLEYRSDQAAGDPAAYQLLVQLSGTNVPAVLKGIRLTIEVAGRAFTQDFPPAPNQSHLFVWDGLDAYGRTVPGQQTVRVRLDYLYDAYYTIPVRSLPANFGLPGGEQFIPQRIARGDRLSLSQSFSTKLGSLSRKGHGLGGWGLSAHHMYDPEARVLYLGTGERRSAESINLIVKRVAGALKQFGPIGQGDGGPAINAFLSYPYGVAFAPDGSLLIAEGGANRVRRVTPDGIIHTVAGNGSASDSGDGGLAVNAGVFFPTSVAVGPDGSLYIPAGTAVRRVAPNGIISTVAGTGAYPALDDSDIGDGGPATQAKMYAGSIAVAPDGTLYIDGSGGSVGNRIRRVGPDGIITTIAGKGPPGFSGDGGPATEALLNVHRAIKLGPDGSLYIADGFNVRVRRITPDGIINTVVGGGSLPLGSDGVPATELNPYIVNIVDVTPDGTIFFSSVVTNGFQYVYRVSPDGIAHLHAGVRHAYGMGDRLADNVPGRQAEFDARGLAVGPDGAVYLSDNEPYQQVRRIAPPLPGFDGGEILIPSAEASEVYVFDKNGRHLRTVLALTGATLLEFHYDSAGRLSSVQDGNGLVTTIEHDASGNPTGVLAPFGQHTTLTTNPDGFLANVTNPAGETTQLGYSGVGLLASVTGPKGDVYSFTYDSLGHLLSATDPAGGSTTLVSSNTANGYEVQATSAMGRVTHYLVETLTNGIQRRLTTYPDGTQMESLRGKDDGTRTTTSPSGTVITSVEGPDPRFGMQSPVLNSLTIRTPAGLTNTVNSVRTVTLTNPDDPFSISNLTDTVVINGRTNRLIYTAANRTVIATSAEGRSSTNQMDALGRSVFSQSAGLNPASFVYDALGRLTNSVTSSGADLRSTRLGFDTAGRLQTLVNALGQSFAFDYDAADRLTQQHLPGARTVGFGYDLNGRTVSITPPGRPAHRFTNDIVNQLASYTPPVVDGVTNTERYQYNADRDSTNVARMDGQNVAFTYDAAGRVIQTTYPNLETLNFSYHPASGQLTNISSSDGGSLTFARDGSLLTNVVWTGAVTGRVNFFYDQEFRLATQLVNEAAPIQFLYNQDSLLTNAGSLRLNYQPQNALLNTTALGAVADARTYSGFGELTNYTASFSNAPLYTYSLKFNALGRITNKAETIAGQTVSYDYAYDVANRLREVRTNGLLAAAYTYDLNGNRLSRTNDSQIAAYSYDDRDRLRQRTVGAEVTQFAYTPNGELRTQTVAGASTTYNYDARGNLRQVVLPDATQIEYVVDGASRRIGKKVNGVLVNGFLYQDALNPIAELDGNNNLISRFIYATRVNVPEYMIRDGVTYRILCDHLGSVRLVINTTNGVVAQRIDYDEFGVVLTDTHPGFQPFGFAGGLYDPDTGLVRFGARDYHAKTGQWTDRDPILFEGEQTSLYAYVNNDPINLLDPSGTGPFERDLRKRAFSGDERAMARFRSYLRTYQSIDTGEGDEGLRSAEAYRRAARYLNTVDAVATLGAGKSLASSKASFAKGDYLKSGIQLAQGVAKGAGAVVLYGQFAKKALTLGGIPVPGVLVKAPVAASPIRGVALGGIGNLPTDDPSLP